MDRTRKWILNQIKFFRSDANSAPVLPFSEALAPARPAPLTYQSSPKLKLFRDNRTID